MFIKRNKKDFQWTFKIKIIIIDDFLKLLTL